MSPQTPASPLYRQFAAAIQARISSGWYPPGSDLPTEQSMAQEFGVSRECIRHGLTVLRGQGIVTCQRGRRAQVRPQPQRTPIHLLDGQTAVARMPTDAERADLDIPEGTPVLVVGDRVHRADHVMVVNG